MYFKEDPGVVCAAIGLCQSQQAALAKAQEQLMSNEIPMVDLSQRVSPFLINVPQLLYPQESPKKEAPQQETPKKVHRLNFLCTHMEQQQYVLHLFFIRPWILPFL